MVNNRSDASQCIKDGVANMSCDIKKRLKRFERKEQNRIANSDFVDLFEKTN